MIEGLHCKVDQLMIGRFLAFSGRIFDAIPLRFGHSNGLDRVLAMWFSILPERYFSQLCRNVPSIIQCSEPDAQV